MGFEWMSCPLVLACDEAYAMQLATTIRSIADVNRNAWPLDVHVLSDGFSERMRKKVLHSLPNGSALIHWVQVDLGLFREFSTINYISKMTYARFLIPHVFPEISSRVLYLDADLLVLDDLGPLWETDLGGAVLGAVMDYGLNLKLKQDEPALEEVPRVRDYFNAGVLLIDLKRWRKEQISQKALEYLNRNPRSPFSDQDALNVACDGLWKKLETRWNFQEHYKIKISEMGPDERPGIVHFVTSLKPWNPIAMNPNARLYDTFRSRTCFARTTTDKLWDTIQGAWSRLKSVLRQHVIPQGIWNYFKLAKRS